MTRTGVACRAARAALVAAGLAGPVLAGLPRLGLPLVVGEIAAGVLLGRTGLGIVDRGVRGHWIALTDIATVLAVPVVLATGSEGSVLLGGGLVLLAGGAVWYC